MSSDQADRIWQGPETGSKVASYRLEDQIGRGGMAVVYRARHEPLNRLAALKILPPALAQDTMFRDRFLRESRAAALVEHPNIVPVYDAGDSGGFLYIAMRYVPGGDVHQLLARTGPLPPARACAIIGQVAAALDAAHRRGLVHRDVKPQNMLLDVPDETAAQLAGSGPDRVLLSDFGISKQADGTGITRAGGWPPGTYHYIAPERLDGRAVDGRADQYSLACAAFELLTVTLPFLHDLEPALVHAHLFEPPPAVSERRPGLSVAADVVLRRALAKDPADRFDSCTTFAHELRTAFLPAGPLPETVIRPDVASDLASAEEVRRETAARLVRPSDRSGLERPELAPAGPSPEAGRPPPGPVPPLPRRPDLRPEGPESASARRVHYLLLSIPLVASGALTFVSNAVGPAVHPTNPWLWVFVLCWVIDSVGAAWAVWRLMRRPRDSAAPNGCLTLGLVIIGGILGVYIVLPLVALLVVVAPRRTVKGQAPDWEGPAT